MISQSLTTKENDLKPKNSEPADYNQSLLSKVKPSLKSVGKIDQPDVKAVMASGQLGGILHPNHSPSQGLEQPPRGLNTLSVENADFAGAMDEWNRHNYTRAADMMKDYIARFPDGTWAGEAQLHMGCDARFNGRYREAGESFSNVIEKYNKSGFEGARRVAEKAKSRLADLRVMENSLGEAERLFSELKTAGSDWRQRTYAAAWLQRIAKLKGQGKALANCGSRAFSEILKRDGKPMAAEKVRALLPESDKGFNIKELQSIANEQGYAMKALKLEIEELSTVPLPAIAHVDRSDTGGLGHYWIIEAVGADEVTVYDEQKHRRFTQSKKEFSKEWDGRLLVFAATSSPSLAALPGVELSPAEAEQTYGGCCGIQRPENDLGNPGCNGGRGCPVWTVNMVNMNHYVTDTPLWYDTPYGPDVEIQLSYNSQSALAQYEPMGNKWSFNYTSYLVEDPGEAATVFMADGRRAIFIADGKGGFEKSYGDDAVLRKISDTLYKLEQPDGEVLTYGIPAGTQSQQVMLTKITDVHGQSLTFQYNAAVQLESIQDAQGRATAIRYNSDSRIKEIEDPFGRLAYFEYDARGNLIQIADMANYASTIEYDDNAYITAISKPEEGTWTFKTELPDGIRNDLDPYPPPGGDMWEDYRITVTDPDNKRSEYHYDGNHSKSWYVSPKQYVEYQSETVNNYTEAVKTRYTYRKDSSGRGEIRKISFADGSDDSYSRTFEHDDHGRVIAIGEANSVETRLTYNGSGQIVETKEAAEQDLERITQFEYLSPALALPTRVVYPALVDGSHLERLIEYDNSNNPAALTLKQTDAQGAETLRTTRYQYNDTHQVTQIDGPRTDVPDTTTLTYYDCSPVVSYCGQIQSSTNTLGHVTTYSEYTQDGKVGRIEAPNGLVTLYSYDGLGREISATQFSKETPDLTRQTTYSYEGVNRLKKLTRSDGSSLEYFYTGSGDIAQVINQDGEQIQLANDADGNPETIKLLDIEGVIKKERTQGFNADNQLVSSTNAQGHAELFDYSLGLLDKITDANGNTREFSYDDLQRLTDVKRANSLDNKTTRLYIDYAANDQVDKVTAQNALETAYTLNAFGDVSQRLSPDTGSTGYQYDEAGNLVYAEDARGIEVVYSYDALNRLLFADYVNDAEDIAYAYDDIADGNPGLGRLSQIQDETGETRYQYDAFGQVTQVTQQLAGKTFSTQYRYNDDGALAQITYPSGKIVDYAYTAGQLQQVSQTDNGETQILAEQFAYLPFGPRQQMQFGNGLAQARQYNLDYQLEQDQIGGVWDKSFGYTKVGYIQSITDSQNPDHSLNVGFDPEGRINLVETAQGFKVIGYDKVGNRSKSLTCPRGRYEVESAEDCIGLYQSSESACSYDDCDVDFCTYAADPACDEPDAGQNVAAESKPSYEIYHYAQDDNLLTHLGNQVFTYDEMGNTLTKGDWTYEYNQQGRLSAAVSGSVNAGYQYNAMGQRVIKTLDGVQTFYLYSPDDQLIAELDGQGNIIKEYVYADEEPLAQLQDGAIYYYHNSHLGTPEVLTDQAQNIVWQARHDVFGQADVLVDTVENNLRFPGQYYDQETGLHYNYFRYYDPSTGRYITSDPIGLDGGINTYIYVGNNPLYWTDFYGLAIGDLPPPPPGYNPSTWGHSTNSLGKDVLTDPDSGSWTAHPEDKGHWRHWDKQRDGKKSERWPKKSKKKWPNQKKPPYGDQSDEDPSGDAEPWCPTDGGSKFSPFPFVPPIPGRGGPPVGGSRGGAGCFVEGTRVLTDAGYKDIKEIGIGDIVYSFDHKNAEVQWKKVIKKFESFRTDLIDVTIDNGNTVISSSSNHQYFVSGKGYTEARDLAVGDMLLDKDKKSILVEAVATINKKDAVKVYNFTVEGNHNYYVSETSVLVHNTKLPQRHGPLFNF